MTEDSPLRLAIRVYVALKGTVIGSVWSAKEIIFFLRSLN